MKITNFILHAAHAANRTHKIDSGKKSAVSGLMMKRDTKEGEGEEEAKEGDGAGKAGASGMAEKPEMKISLGKWILS